MQPEPIGMPHSREAEEAVIGCVLINEHTFHEIRTAFDGAQAFYIHRLRFIWEAYERLVERRQPIDILTVADELSDMGRLEEIGGPAYLTSLLNQVPSTLHAVSYAAIIHEKSIRRSLLLTANQIAEMAYDESASLDEVSNRAVHAVSQVSARALSGQMVDIADAVRETDLLVEQRGKLAELPGIPTGLVDLDKLLGGGAQNSTLYEVAARPGQGKTSLLLQIARNGAMRLHGPNVIRNNVVIFSLEMPQEQLVLRMVSQLTGIDYQALYSGRIPEDRYANSDNGNLMGYYSALETLQNMHILIDDTPGVSPAYIRSRCEVLAASGQLDMVVIDYLGLSKTGMRFGKTSEEVDYIAREFKEIARTFVVPVWTAHQMNRNVEKRERNTRMQLSDLNEGGEKDADCVIFINNQADDAGNITETNLDVAKHRNGPTGLVPTFFRKQFTRFENATRVSFGRNL